MFLNNLFLGAMLSLFVATGLASSLPPVADKSESKAPSELKHVQGAVIELTVAVVLDSPGPTLSFTMTNAGKVPIPALRLMQPPSYLVIVNSDGKEWADNVSAGPPPPGTKVPMLAPGETTQPEKLNIYEWLAMARFKEPGLYRVYRKIVQVEGDNIIEYKSNEVLILWEKGTPPLNPSTGRPE